MASPAASALFLVFDFGGVITANAFPGLVAYSEHIFDVADVVHHLYQRLPLLRELTTPLHCIVVDEVQDLLQASQPQPSPQPNPER